jgi:hypothetical protein
MALCFGQYVVGLYVRPRYGLPARRGKRMSNTHDQLPELANVWDDYGYEDDWDPHQRSECQRWTENGILSELDDSFVCDECAMGYTHAYGGDCA